MSNVTSQSTSFHSAPITGKSSTDPVSNGNISIPKAQPDTTNPVQPDQLQKAVNEIEKFAQAASQNLKFSIDEDTGKTVIKVMDATTDEIVRQIPSEEAIDIARSLSKIHGALFNGHA
ncbi:flagellar biosynthesis protein FlaG [Nitrosomonas supralitoralis]|uniref:Flagellar biosynthesis protein FlaG n=2 Tax=Nitrosomonas supralitoralis TaxID=2116706 RepID=A0A2P7NYA0_9PROT|nr:flagellar biosynthesis protein FlaG [Nitrosomonas supralitoralis]